MFIKNNFYQQPATINKISSYFLNFQKLKIKLDDRCCTLKVKL